MSRVIRKKSDASNDDRCIYKFMANNIFIKYFMVSAGLSRNWDIDTLEIVDIHAMKVGTTSTAFDIALIYTYLLEIRSNSSNHFRCLTITEVKIIGKRTDENSLSRPLFVIKDIDSYYHDIRTAFIGFNEQVFSDRQSEVIASLIMQYRHGHVADSFREEAARFRKKYFTAKVIRLSKICNGDDRIVLDTRFDEYEEEVIHDTQEQESEIKSHHAC